ncbi:5-(carboxyamino)imidazole ribonucleotide mutase [bacterium]|nr:5-(carboxyamino)imidazole ribonucleotide mutase [bacterium]
MAKVAIVSGSVSDSALVDIIQENLDRFGVEYEASVRSAHRMPEKLREFTMSAADNGFQMIIAVAGLAAHLPGAIASMTDLPVIGVPAGGGPLNGVDALLSMVQMPGSTPVATMAIGKAGAKNAAIFAARIFALNDEKIAAKVEEYRRFLREGGK